MKQFTTSPIIVKFPNLDLEQVEKIDFVVKEEIARDGYPLIKARWSKVPPNSDSIIVVPDPVDGVFTIQVPEEVSSQLPINKDGTSKTIWLDTRVIMSDGKIPSTPLQKIRVMPTLFSEDYEEEGGEW